MNNSRLLTALCALATITGSSALEVTTTAGSLNEQVSDKTITELKVNGEIDARDIKCIAEEMPNLQVIDLGGVDIKAYISKDKLLGGISDYEADQLPPYSFFDRKYTQITLPTTLKSIGEGAMAGCEKVGEIVLPSGLTEIGNYALNGMTALKSITLPGSVTKIGAYAFARSGVEAADLSALGSATNIEVKAFANCANLTSVKLPITATTIAPGMLEGCTALTEIALPASIESIGEEAFMQSGLKNIDLGACAKLRTIGRWAFANVPVESVGDVKGIESIGEGAFFYNDQLQDLTLPSKVNEISDFVLAGCSEITEGPIVGEGVKKIGRFAFADMKKMNNPELPSTVNEIGERAFENTAGMTELKVNATEVPAVGESVWSGIDQSLVKLKVPEASIPLYKNAEQWKEFLITDLSNVELAKTDSDIKAYFANKILNIKASTAIKRASVYDPSGVLLATVSPASESAQIDTENLGGHLYITVIVLESGEAKTIKLIRR